MYKNVDTYPQDKFYTKLMVDGINNGDLIAVCQNVFNAFGSVCDNEKLTQDINETKPLAVSLSGSGPTVFAIYKDLVTAQKAKELLKIKGYNPIIATPTKNGIIE